MSARVTRREAVAGLATAAAIAPTAALPKLADRKAWDVAWAAYIQARRESDALENRVVAINEAFQKGCEALPTVAGPSKIREARSAMQRLAYIENIGDNFERYRGYHAIIQADDARQVQVAAIDKRLGYTEVNNRFDVLLDRYNEAERVLLDMPAPDGEALLWKISKLYVPGEGVWAEGVEDQTHADLRRLLLNGRA